MILDGNNKLVDMNKAHKKWGHIVEKMGITDPTKKDRIVEYAELHSSSLKKNKINENAMYGNAANTAGMGNVVFPGLSGTPGLPGTAGSGDLGEIMLPAALKIAAHTPGLDLLPVVNVNSNRVDLLYFDWKYDDNNTSIDDELMTTFKFKLADDAANDALIADLRADMVTSGITELRGRISSPIYYNFNTGAMSLTEPTGAKTDWLQFKGFSRIDGLPMFRSWTQSNTASSGGWTFDPSLNTFGPTGSITTQLGAATLTVNGNAHPLATGTPAVDPTVLAVSLNEDFIDDFTTNRHKSAMSRGEWDVTEAGKIGPDSFVASVEIGVAHVQASLRLSEIGDWKRMYGVDVVQKTIEQLTIQLSQKISTEIVDKIQELGLRNRVQAPAHPNAASPAFTAAGITDAKIYDFSTTLVAGALGGENTMSIARKLWSKVQQASFFVATDGRIGGADYLIASGTVIGVLKSIENYQFNPLNGKLALPGQLKQEGEIDGIKLYIDPYKNPADLDITIGRVGTQFDPGAKYFAYMLAETVEVVDNRLFAPTIYMYSRYAVAEFGFFPEKQYYTIKVEDNDGLLY